MAGKTIAYSDLAKVEQVGLSIIPHGHKKLDVHSLFVGSSILVANRIIFRPEMAIWSWSNQIVASTIIIINYDGGSPSTELELSLLQVVFTGH